jgi:hypothetical protein
MGGRGRGGRITVKGAFEKSTRLYLKNKLKQKGLGTWLKWLRAYSQEGLSSNSSTTEERRQERCTDERNSPFCF